LFLSTLTTTTTTLTKSGTTATQRASIATFAFRSTATCPSFDRWKDLSEEKTLEQTKRKSPRASDLHKHGLNAPMAAKRGQGSISSTCFYVQLFLAQILWHSTSILSTMLRMPNFTNKLD
jgi:hypothetical protein